MTMIIADTHQSNESSVKEDEDGITLMFNSAPQVRRFQKLEKLSGWG